MNTAFDARSLEQRYGFLDECPEALLDEVMALTTGSLEERVQGALAWRRALLDGRLPAAVSWPPSELADPVRQALGAMDILRFCRGHTDLTDALMIEIVRAFARHAVVLTEEVNRQLRELERLERVRIESEEAARAKKEHRARHSILIDEETLGRLRDEALRAVSLRKRSADEEFTATWGERARAWASIADVFGDLGELMGRGWDMSLGVLRTIGWLDILKLRDLVEKLPELRRIVQQLGRLHMSVEGESVAEKILVPMRRIEEELREVITPLAPAETRGIERSGDISRMLPSESVMLGHPVLRYVWHARRAERALLTYRVEGLTVERVMTERESHEEIEGKKPRPERGPILIIVDTSGSMHGLPERVAKALALEALRTAHAERRRCLLYAFSGPGQIIEHELDLTPEGLGRLMAFLQFTFGGGSDETGVMQKVLARLRSEDWKRSDVLFISDGEWPVPRPLIAAVNEAREVGTCFHGVQIGNRGRTGLHQICDPVHVFSDWTAAGGG